MADMKTLLAITELGGYPDFQAEYQQAGYQVVAVNSMRKAISVLKKQSPELIVAEFNFQSDFRDRSSNLESLLATLQGKHPHTRMLVFYEHEYIEPFKRLCERWPIDASLAFPIGREQLVEVLRNL